MRDVNKDNQTLSTLSAELLEQADLMQGLLHTLWRLIPYDSMEQDDLDLCAMVNALLDEVKDLQDISDDISSAILDYEKKAG